MNVLSEEIKVGLIKSFNQNTKKGWLIEPNGETLFFELKGAMVLKETNLDKHNLNNWIEPVSYPSDQIKVGVEIFYIKHKGPRGLFAKFWML